MSQKLSVNDIRSLGASQLIQSFFLNNDPSVTKEDDGTYSITSRYTLRGLSESEALQALRELALDYEF